MSSKNNGDIFGKAILDFYNQKDAVIQTYSSVGGWDELPVEYLFRSFDEMPDLEQKALQMTFGKVLDLGCGAGSHSLYLKNQGLSVKPIDISKGAIDVCKLRGLEQAEMINLWSLKYQKFDTILALMNGAGICGSIDKFPNFLEHLKTLLAPDGQILMDSSDIIYMFEDHNGEVDLTGLNHYYGEVEFRSRYQGQTSDSYPWLYIDYFNLEQHAHNQGLHCELVIKGSHYDYLARLTPQE